MYCYKLAHEDPEHSEKARPLHGAAGKKGSTNYVNDFECRWNWSFKSECQHGRPRFLKLCKKGKIFIGTNIGNTGYSKKICE